MSQRVEKKPPRLHALWDVIEQGLSSPFWMRKGLSSHCPFCFKASSPGNEKFLIHFNDGQFTMFNCFVCQQSGSGMRGVLKLARQLGVEVNSFDAASMAGQSGEGVYRPREEKKEVVEPIEWLPRWIEESDELLLSGLDYLERQRKIPLALDVIEKYELAFSNVVEREGIDGAYLADYPCILFPSVGLNDEILGWEARSLQQNRDGAPKSLAMPGREWKKQSLFGLREVDPRKPVTIVEGALDALSTPNAVALLGKSMDLKQIELLAGLHARVYVFALDPEVKEEHFATVRLRLKMKAPQATVLFVDWRRYRVTEQDPNDLGYRRMTEIIRDVVTRAMT